MQQSDLPCYLGAIYEWLSQIPHYDFSPIFSMDYAERIIGLKVSIINGYHLANIYCLDAYHAVSASHLTRFVGPRTRYFDYQDPESLPKLLDYLKRLETG